MNLINSNHSSFGVLKNENTLNFKGKVGEKVVSSVYENENYGSEEIFSEITSKNYFSNSIIYSNSKTKDVLNSLVDEIRYLHSIVDEECLNKANKAIDILKNMELTNYVAQDDLAKLYTQSKISKDSDLLNYLCDLDEVMQILEDEKVANNPRVQKAVENAKENGIILHSPAMTILFWTHAIILDDSNKNISLDDTTYKMKKLMSAFLNKDSKFNEDDYEKMLLTSLIDTLEKK